MRKSLIYYFLIQKITIKAFLKGVFSIITFNLGPQKIIVEHVYSVNLSYGWIGVTASENSKVACQALAMPFNAF